jgi:hypothetical protein
VSPDPGTRANKPVDRSVRGTTALHAVVHRPIQFLAEYENGRDDIEVTVNKEFVEKGQHQDEALALLGLDRGEMDRAWYSWAVRHRAGVRPPEQFAGSSREAFEAHRRQDGAFWRVEAEVDGPEQREIDDLAFYDQRAVRRTVTFRARYWADMTKFWSDVGEAGYRHVEETKPLEQAAAVGMWYSGIEDEDIEATARSIAALYSARRHLEDAHRQIYYALQVAEGAWKGDRANAVKFHFGAELLVVEGIRDATHGWEDFSQQIHLQQRLAQDQDAKFRRMLYTELAISGALLVITLGAGTILRAATFTARLLHVGAEFQRAQRFIRGLHEATYGRMVTQLGSVRLARAASWGTVNAAHTGAVRAAGGQDMTMEDWVLAYGLAFGIEGVGALRQLITGRYKVGFRDPAPGERPTFAPPKAAVPGPGVRPNTGTGAGGGHGPGGRPDGGPPVAGGGGTGTPPTRPPRRGSGSPADEPPDGGRVPGNGPGDRATPRYLDARRQRRWYGGARTPDLRTPPRTVGGEVVAPPIRVIRPSRRPNPGLRPDGTPSRPRRGNELDDISENDTAVVVARYGFRVRQRNTPEGRQEPPIGRNHPSVRAGHVDPDRSPDFEIEGRLFDNKRVTSTNVQNIYTEHLAKSGQANGLILDMTGNPVTNDQLIDYLRFQAITTGETVPMEIWVRRGDELVPIWPL